MIWLIFIPLWLISGVIENNITQAYHQIYPSIIIKHIKISNYRNQKIHSIDTSMINPKRNAGTIKVNDFYVFYKLDATIKVLKSITYLNKGDKLSRANTALQRIPFTNLYTYPVTTYTDKVIKMYLPANRVIYQYMLANRSLVKRGDIIEVISKSGAIEVSFRAVALSNGKAGDKIKVKKDKQVLEVTLDNDGNGRL
ncbi:MAG: flagellar basal body P-ring formation protein FlgA [Epsilonproteobacteria bacterium]|nr:flagellar basal body P-ring formation protein FlgA [Campylobacterota bacterium]